MAPAGFLAHFLPPPSGAGTARVSLDAASARRLAGPLDALARAEGLPVHGLSATARAETTRKQNEQTGDNRTRRRTRRASSSVSTSTARRPAPTTGVGFFDHMLDLLARHANIGLHGRRRPVTSRPARTTRSKTSASCSARRIDQALGDRSGIRRYGSRRGADGRSLRRVRARHLRPAALGLPGRHPGHVDRQLRDRTDRGVLPGGCQRGEDDPPHARSVTARTCTT